ncbi:MAG: T9SS type A sorting domain-containing protein [Bacteroidetes bacterium]|nr:T9SS type A sorting domain-containing protein [Bacteroidota bacterium]
MKPISLFLFIILVISNICLSQQTFETLIRNPEDQVIHDFLEDSNGNLLLIGRSIAEGQTYNSSFLLKLDSNGCVIYENFDITSDTISTTLTNIFYINEYYYLIGAEKSTDTPVFEMIENKISLIKLNNELQLISHRTFSIPENRWFSYINSIVDSDTNFVLTGYVTRYDTTTSGVVFRNHDAFFYKISLEGDSLASHFYTSEIPWHFSFDIIESTDKSKYYAYVSHFIPGANQYDSQRLTLDKNLDSIALEPIPFYMYDPNSPVYLNETDVLISGKGTGDYPRHHVIAIHNEAGEIINTNHFKKEPYREQPPMKNGISKFGDNIFVGGISNFDIGNPFWSSQNSWFHLVKVNTDLSMVWEKWFGGDAYYFMYNILATRDGGCIMVGNRYDDQTQNQERDVYIVKVNGDGLIVWEREISMNDRFSIVYPNPGHQLNIRLAAQHSQALLSLFDQYGRLVLQQQLTQPESLVETTHLLPGVYLYQLAGSTGLSESGKWVKK